MRVVDTSYAIQLLYALSICLLLSSCGDNSATSSASDTVTLNQSNIKQYAHQIAEDYSSQLNNLLSGYNKARQSGESFDFIQYRNSVWTPAYIKKKEFYDELLADNKPFLSSHPASDLFVLFDSLIYIGIDLKNGLLDNDPERANKALARAKEAKSTVLAILTRIDQQP
jgi:hypothetical protein